MLKIFIFFVPILINLEIAYSFNDMSIRNQAIRVYSSGSSMLLNKLPDHFKIIYKNDIDSIKNFHLTNYKKQLVKELGFFLIDNKDDTIKKTLLKGDPWEPNIAKLIKKFTKPGTTALDIGSHIGTHSLTMSQAVGKNGQVLAFEPNKKIFFELCFNLAINKISNVLPLRLALGKDISVIQTVTPLSYNEGGTFIQQSCINSSSTAMIRLDDINLENVSFIKIDVENMEADVIDGAEKTIKKNQPVILVEIQGNGERPLILGEDTTEMTKTSIKKIENLNYRLHHISGCDYLCLPK